MPMPEAVALNQRHAGAWFLLAAYVKPPTINPTANACIVSVSSIFLNEVCSES